MTDELANLLEPLDRWGDANLDKSWKKMGMNSNSGEETEEKNGDDSGQEKWRWIGQEMICWRKPLIPVGISNRD